jgi:hypothetical protein
MTITAGFASLHPILWESDTGSATMQPVAAPIVVGMIAEDDVGPGNAPPLGRRFFGFPGSRSLQRNSRGHGFVKPSNEGAETAPSGVNEITC